MALPSSFNIGADWWKEIGKMKKQNYGSIPPSRVKLSSFDPPSSSSSSTFFFLLSFLSVTSYRLQLRFQTRVIDWFSRFTSACHVRPFSLRRRCPFQSSHRCRHKETRLCILSCVISFWSKRNYAANIYYLRIIFGYGETDR